MFANLKNKLIEEVKASPSKFQQLANAAQAAVSSSSNTTPSGSESAASTVTANENFFSITEDDTPENTPMKTVKAMPPATIKPRNPMTQQMLNNSTGVVPRTRKLSNSSMASDMSFRLPHYETGSVYHLQSDVDESGSEIGETVSVSAKLNVAVTKEQLYEAYRKSLDRYHKYRCRYTDLTKKYKELERDSTKARSVLVETQEKAIRRINELREQCALEQQAKAHLEETLRVEIDDMQCKMQAYQTKLKLLGENPDAIAAALEAASSRIKNNSLIDIDDDNDNVNNDNITTTSNNNMIVNHIEHDNQTTSEVTAKDDNDNGEDYIDINELKRKLLEQEEQIKQLNQNLEIMRKQEEENVLLLAQTKAAIHSELENKESEVKTLTEHMKTVQNELQKATKKLEQNKSLNEELTELKEKFKQSQETKQEIEAKMIASEHLLNENKEKLLSKEKTIQNLQDQLNNVMQKYEETENELKEKNEKLDSLNEMELKECLREIDILQNTLQDKDIQIVKMTKIHEEELENLSRRCENERQLNEKIVELEKQLLVLQESKTNEANRHEEILNRITEQLAVKERELKTLTRKTSKNEKQYESQYTTIQQQFEEIEKLQKNLQQQEQLLGQMRQESTYREDLAEKEKSDLRKQVNDILREISQMEEQMHLVQKSHQQLEMEKVALEKRIEEQNYNDHAEVMRYQELYNEIEVKLHDTEAKLQNVESEHQQLAEKNCLLEESANRLEKLLAEKDHHQQQQQKTVEDALISKLQLQLKTSENAVQKLKEKMSAILDENSRLHNNQELSDHDYRTLQDKYDALQKEKDGLDDSKNFLEQELIKMKEQFRDQMQKFKELQQIHDNAKIQIEQLQPQLEKIKDQNVKEMKKMEELLQQKEFSVNEMEQKYEELKKNYNNTVQEYEAKNGELIKQRDKLIKEQQLLKEFKDNYQKLEQDNFQITQQLQEQQKQQQHHKTQIDTILQKQEDKTKALEIQLNKKDEEIARLENQLKMAEAKYDKNIKENSSSEQLQLECEHMKKHIEQLETKLRECIDSRQNEEKNAGESKEKIKSLQCEMYVLKDQIDEYKQAQLHKEKCLLESQVKIKRLTKQLEKNEVELQRQSDHVKYITEQDDVVKSDLLKSQQKVKEYEMHYNQMKRQLEDMHAMENAQREQMKQQIAALQKDVRDTAIARDDLLQQLNQLRDETDEKEIAEEDIKKFKQEFSEFSQAVAITKASSASCSPNSRNMLVSQEQTENLRKINATLQKELEELKHKSSTEIISLQQEMDDLQNVNKQMAERIMDLERLKAGLQAQKLFGLDHPEESNATAVTMTPQIALTTGPVTISTANDDLPTDKELEDKLKSIMAEVQDVSNRNLFLEQKCENYLILEQSNERLKLQNAKLSRQLDETLVSLQHCDGASANTEFEYLRNIMFQYLTGTANGNNETLVKVISAVLKFSPQQTQVALEKEHQRRSLLNKIL